MSFEDSLTPPLLLVDIDGVINHSGEPLPRDFKFSADLSPTHQGRAGQYRIDVRADVPELLQELAAVTEPVWATTWEHEAARVLAPVIGIGHDWPVIEFTMGRVLSRDTWKLPQVREFAHDHLDRPLAWLDDDIGQDARRWAAARMAPTLLIRVDSWTGLTRTHADEVLAWVAEL